MDETKENKSVERKRWRNFKMENVRSSGKAERLQEPDQSLLAPRDSGKWSFFQLCVIYIEM